MDEVGYFNFWYKHSTTQMTTKYPKETQRRACLPRQLGFLYTIVGTAVNVDAL